MVKNEEKPICKQCRVKTDGLIRYQKEYNSYLKEIKGIETKLVTVKAAGEPHEINRWNGVLEDTTQMLPNIKGKMEQQVEDLEMFLEEYAENADLKANEVLLEKSTNTVNNIRLFLEQLEIVEEPEEKVEIQVTTEEKVETEVKTE